MKKYLFLLPLILMLTACDAVSEDDRYIETGEIEVARRVLLEEFTGQECTNCPAAHAVIEKLQEQYGDDLVVVSIHAGGFGVPAPYGLMQPQGDEYAARWDITAYPAGVVDRKGSAMGAGGWATAIRSAAEEETDLQLTLEAEIEGNNIEIDTSLFTSGELKGKLQLWVIENGIVAFQIDEGDLIPDYVHNNVFRACVNGLWGEEISLQANSGKEYTNTIALDEKWNPANLFIVGFVYNDTGVIQVNKCAVK